MKELKLNKNMVALVDEEDYDRLSMYKWRVVLISGKNYASTYIKKGDRIKNTFLHRDIMEVYHGELMRNNTKIVVDHINGNGLDCRKSNMRLATSAQNRVNSVKAMIDGVSSKYKGVCCDHRIRGKRWRAAMSFEGKSFWKYFGTEEEAAIWYNKMVEHYYGSFAILNQVDGYDTHEKVYNSLMKDIRNSVRWLQEFVEDNQYDEVESFYMPRHIGI